VITFFFNIITKMINTNTFVRYDIIYRGDSMKNNILIYTSKDGNIKVDVNMIDDNIWMSQDLMSNLYDTTKQ